MIFCPINSLRVSIYRFTYFLITDDAKEDIKIYEIRIDILNHIPFTKIKTHNKSDLIFLKSYFKFYQSSRQYFLEILWMSQYFGSETAVLALGNCDWGSNLDIKSYFKAWYHNNPLSYHKEIFIPSVLTFEPRPRVSIGLVMSNTGEVCVPVYLYT